MLRRTVDSLSSAVDRRGFVGSLAVAAGAVIATIFGAPTPGEACPSSSCCSLCLSANPHLCGGCGCSWAWTCCASDDDLSLPTAWNCQECYQGPDAPNPCGPGCEGVTCSAEWYNCVGVGCC